MLSIVRRLSPAASACRLSVAAAGPKFPAFRIGAARAFASIPKPEIVPNTVEHHRYVSRVPGWNEDHFVTRDCPTVWRAGNDAPDELQRLGFSSHHLAHYRLNGYCLVQSAFSRMEVAALRSEVQALREAKFGDSDDPRVVLEPSGDAVRSVFEVHKNHPVFSRLAYDERVLEIVRYLLNDDVYVHQSRINFQPPFKGTGFGWHSDFETWHSEDGLPQPRALSAVVLLSDNRAENGSLMVIPGSQEYFVGCKGETPKKAWETSLKHKLYFGTPSSESLDTLVNHMGFGLHSCLAPAGSLLLFDSNLMHASTNNMSAFDRVNAFFAFTACSNAAGPIFTGEGRPEYLATRDPDWQKPMQPVLPSTWLVEKIIEDRNAVYGEAKEHKELELELQGASEPASPFGDEAPSTSSGVEHDEQSSLKKQHRDKLTEKLN